MYCKSLELKKNANNWNYLDVELEYNIGGYNYFSGKETPRGYYLSVQPIERGEQLSSVIAFTGTNFLIKEVKRKSNKAEAEAEQIAKEKENEYINYVLNKNNIELL